uniref:Candidate secreted effector n=1 Tax=Meloidogyne incognita TaxID=6306 RepID=A0A914NL22_MELIC
MEWRMRKREEEEMEILDVTTIEAPDYLQSSDEEELEDFSTDLENGKSLWFVPVVPEIDLVEEETIIKSESRPNSATKTRNPGKSQAKSKRSK